MERYAHVEKPEWANWIAEDRDGVVVCFEHKPTIDMEFGFWESDKDRYETLIILDPDEFWYKSLREIVRNESKPESALEVQEGGNHYKDMKIQPVEYIHANGLGYIEGNVVKYISRHKFKGGAEDIKKAIHYCQMILEMEYDNEAS